MLYVNNASIKYGSEFVWKDVNFTIQSGQFIAITGPNGAGKSTLIKCIAGLLKLDSGNIKIKFNSSDHIKEISYVPQFSELNYHIPLRGIDFVKLGLDGHHWGLDSRVNRANHEFDLIKLLKDLDAYSYAYKDISKLSGGQLQRLRVAQALICKPKLLLCDEALTSLDLHSQTTIVNTINNRKKKLRMTILFVSHDMDILEKTIDAKLKVFNKTVRWI